jgi:hypothetical protein
VAAAGFYQSLKVKYKAADWEEQFVATAGNTKQSLYFGYLPFCDIHPKNFFNFNCQLQEEAGSAAGQPAGNKADTYTVIMSSQLGAAHFYLLPVSHMA